MIRLVHSFIIDAGVAEVVKALETLSKSNDLGCTGFVGRDCVLWSPPSAAGFSIRYERSRFFVHVSGLLAQRHDGSTDVSIVTRIRSSELFLPLALATVGLYWLSKAPMVFSVLAVSVIAFGVYGARSTWKDANAFVDQTLVPTLRRQVRRTRENQGQERDERPSVPGTDPSV